MSKICELTGRVRRRIFFDGAWWVLTITPVSLTLKPYKKSSKTAKLQGWKEVFWPDNLPLFEELKHARTKNHPAPGTPAPGILHDPLDAMPGVDGN